MNLSCKLTSSVIRFLETQDEDLTPVFSAVSVPEEFLRDPAYWLRAEEFEHFLREVLRQPWNFSTHDLIARMAQSCVQYRSWGVLDSVLRMMSSPHEVFAQPERFLSYFIAPAPPVDRVIRADHAIAFDLPMSADQYPLACEFLLHSFEMIPVFMGLPAAECTWSEIRIEINWQARQDSIFEGVELGRQLSPDLMRDFLKHVGQSEQKNNVAVLKKAETRAPIFQPEVQEIRHHVARLSDYMVRAQQLITLLVGTKRLTPDIKEAMRRVNWEHVQTQFPQTVEQCYQIFRSQQLNASGPAPAPPPPVPRKAEPGPVSSDLPLAARPTELSFFGPTVSNPTEKRENHVQN